MNKEDDILEAFRNYYFDLFQADEVQNIDEVLAVVKPTITNQIKQCLDDSFSSDEITNAVFQLGANKSPSPDGYNGAFFQSFLEYCIGIMPSTIYITDLVLIWIFLNSNPLACVTSRAKYKPFLYDIIFTEQSAFIAEN